MGVAQRPATARPLSAHAGWTHEGRGFSEQRMYKGRRWIRRSVKDNVPVDTGLVTGQEIHVGRLFRATVFAPPRCRRRAGRWAEHRRERPERPVDSPLRPLTSRPDSAQQTPQYQRWHPARAIRRGKR
jgi:hypothetical protein